MSKERETTPASAARPTSADVARRAGVSVPAVSQALSWPEKPGTLSAATRERILRVVAELGYQRSRRAQLFAQGMTRSIALLYEGPAPSDDLITIAIVAAAAAALAEHDYQLVASPFLAAEPRWETFRRDPGVDGALLVHSGTPRLRTLLTGLGLAAVEVGGADGLPARVAADA
nr:LacI family DNA-binding transcriptional regulator [Planctomycetota bacterium]